MTLPATVPGLSALATPTTTAASATHVDGQQPLHARFSTLNAKWRRNCHARSSDARIAGTSQVHGVFSENQVEALCQ